MRKILILKSENENSDNYLKILCKNDFEPVFVPTLDFKFINVERLKCELEKPGNYSGLIFTSPRSVQATRLSLDNDLPKTIGWQQLNNYCVGEATFKIIKSELNLDTKGKDTGNANNLADFIRDDFNGIPSVKPFLFPCGNLKQDILQTKLNDFGFSLHPITVYETIPHPDLGDNLQNFLATGDFQFLVFFSPSGVTYSHEIVQKMKLDIAGVKLIAIGPSTAKAIEKVGWIVCGTSDKPTPESLAQTLNQLMIFVGVI